MADIFDIAIRKNKERQLTGVLLYANGNFIQYLEGPADDLLQVFDSIRRDERHSGLIELMNEPITAREFPDWSLASKKEFFQTFSNPKQYGEFLISATDGVPTKRSAVCDLLHSFWNQQTTTNAHC